MTEQDDRTPPKKIRISGLQDVHITDLKKIDQVTSEAYWAVGFDAAEVPVRTTQDFYAMPKYHAVRVAEADYVVAGFAAWRDEAPGVVYLEQISVHPDYQRFGVATKLMQRLYEETREGFGEVVLRMWSKAVWARAFYAKLGFQEIDDAAPPKVRAWLDDKTDGGRPFLRPGEVALWATIPEP